MKKKVAIIFGVTGQDGSYLAYELIKKNYEIIGITKNRKTQNLKRLNIINKIKLIKFDYRNYPKLIKIFKKKHFDEIFFLAGETSVKKSEFVPYESIISNTMVCLYILEYIRSQKRKIKFFNASSGEIFGGVETNKKKSSENSPYEPKSFYALSKVISLEIIKSYRNQFNIWACSGIFFNHESPLRSKGFVIKKIIDKAKLIKRNKKLKLNIGNIHISRDWGWAPDYVDAIIKIIRRNNPSDFVISTGRSTKLKKVIKIVFSYYGLDYKKFTKVNKKLFRKNEILNSIGNSNKAKKVLPWKPKTNIEKILKNIIEERLF